MSDNENKPKVVIPPEVLEQLQEQMSPEELTEFLNALQEMADSGALFEEAEPVDFSTLEQDDPELFKQLTEQMQADGFSDMEAWIDSKIEGSQRTLH